MASTGRYRIVHDVFPVDEAYVRRPEIVAAGLVDLGRVR